MLSKWEWILFKKVLISSSHCVYLSKAWFVAAHLLLNAADGVNDVLTRGVMLGLQGNWTMGIPKEAKYEVSCINVQLLELLRFLLLHIFR